MMKRILSAGLVLLIGVIHTIGLSAKPGEASGRPNIILIMADDYGAEDIKAYNPDTLNETPNIDKLANEGVQFRICYSAPLCGPSRALIMSGQYPQKTGHWENDGYFNRDHEDFPYDLVHGITFYRTLHEAGYKTAVTGKWDGDKGITPKYMDEACIWPREVKFIPPDVNYRGVCKTDDPIWQPTSRYWQPFIMKNGKFVDTEPNDFGPDIFSDFVLDFAERNKEQSFFIYYPMVLPHAAGFDPKKIATPDPANPGKQTEASQQAMFNYVDHIVGKIVNGVEKLGLAENTIIIFTSDNGSYGKHGKGTTYEPGVWVPFIVNCPALIPARGLVDELVSHADVFPTLAELGGANAPDGLDGISQVPVLNGKMGSRKYIYSYLGSERIVRTHRFLLEKNSADFEGYYYDCGDIVAGAATETSKTAYRDASTDPEAQGEKKRLLKLLDKLHPAPVGIPVDGKEKKAAQRAYDQSIGLY